MGTWGSFEKEEDLAASVAKDTPKHASRENIERVEAVVDSLIGRHSTAARLKKQMRDLIRRFEELEMAS